MALTFLPIRKEKKESIQVQLLRLGKYCPIALAYSEIRPADSQSDKRILLQ